MRLNGCHNRPPFKETMLVQSGYFEDSWFIKGERIARWVTSPFRMERECQYQKDDKYNDQGCVGCVHKSTQGVLL